MKRIYRPFVLLEVFLAITILALAIIPLSSFPYKTYQKQTETLKQIECERISHVAYGDFLTSIDDYFSKEEVELGEYEIDLPTIGKFPYQIVAKLDRSEEDKDHCLLKTTLVMTPENKNGYNPKEQTHFLYVEKK